MCDPKAATCLSAGRLALTTRASHAAQIEQAHMADEWVDTSQLHKMKGILEQWFQLA